MHDRKSECLQPEAMSTLYDRFASTILAYLSQLVSNRHDAEDLLVEVFIAACTTQEIATLPAERQLAWLRRVARNKAVDYYRHTARMPLLSVEQVPDREAEGLTLEQYVERQEIDQHLAYAFEQLSALQQELLRLRYGRGLRLTQIAELWQSPEGTVRKQLARTLLRLRQIYEQRERAGALETKGESQ
jgi:RNA polymerase sigma factor (sigma-70 family)